MPKAILTEQGGKGGGGGDGSFTILSIEVTQTPKKTKYYDGDTFKDEGMKVTAHYGIKGTSAEVSTAEVTGFKCSPTVVTMQTKEITVTYTELGSTCNAKTPINVVHKLSKIVCTNPEKMDYEYGDSLNTGGAVVTAHYSDSQTSIVTGSAKFTPTALNTVGSQVITVSYTQTEVDLESVTQTTSFTVNVGRNQTPKPTWKGTLTYTGKSQSADNLQLWTGYDKAKMTIGGQYTSVTAGTFDARFTPTANYCWEGDKGTDA